MKKSFLKQTLKGTQIYILTTLILSAIYSRLVVYVPMFIQYALDGIIMEKEEVIPSFIRGLFYADNKIAKVLVLVMVLILLNLLIFVVNYSKSKINTKFNLKINRNVKETILKHIPKLEYKEFSSIDKSNVIQRVNNDATTYAEFFNSQINLFFDTIFILLFAVAQTLQLDRTVGIFILITCFVIVLLSIWHYKKTKSLVEDVVEANKEIINKTTISVEESKMLKIFNRRNKEIKDFAQINQDCKVKEMKFAKMKAIYVIVTHSLRNFKEPFILLWGGILVIKGEISLAEISILLSYATKILTYVYDSVDKLSTINEFLVAYKKLAHLMKYKEERETKPDIKLEGDIVFKNVSIKIEENTILENLDFTIKQGENIAIVGDNGSGKTILARTLVGFYDYTGNIYIGKNDIRNVSKKSLRDYIGIVLQDTYLFTDTIENNINITNKMVSKEEILHVCQLADVYEDIKNFEGNVNYRIGKGGNNLSGGQKQRIAIARTLLADNQFIIFDDSLSKLDTNTKITILNNITKMKRGAIIISYDAEVPKVCDKVLFIHHKTVQIDTHEKLIQENQEYKAIIELSQNQILKDEEF